MRSEHAKRGERMPDCVHHKRSPKVNRVQRTVSAKINARPVSSAETRRFVAGGKWDDLVAFDLEYFRRTALLTCEREFLEFTDEQDWCDTDNDHFCSAIRTC